MTDLATLVDLLRTVDFSTLADPMADQDEFRGVRTFDGQPLTDQQRQLILCATTREFRRALQHVRDQSNLVGSMYAEAAELADEIMGTLEPIFNGSNKMTIRDAVGRLALTDRPAADALMLKIARANELDAILSDTTRRERRRTG
jgi:hypothetical protein